MGTVERMGGEMPPETLLEHWFLLASRLADLLAEVLPRGLGDGIAEACAVNYIEEWGSNADWHFRDQEDRQ